jgi:alpha-L-fucosidase 2
MRLTASKPGSISFTAFFTTPQKRATIKTTVIKGADHFWNYF